MPAVFAREYIRGREFVKLQAPDGEEWHGRCCYRSTSSTTIGKGWSTFCKVNNLKEGDACVFELIKREDVVLKVSIFRVVEHAGEAN